MKITIKLATKRAYGVYEDEKLVYQTGCVRSICSFCEERYGFKVPTIITNTPVGMRLRIEWNNTPQFTFEA